jgi:putative membrane protein
MRFSPVGTILLSTAFACPAALFAQFEPAAIPASQTQANRPQQQQPATTSLQDSAPNAGDVGQAMADKVFLRRAAEGGIAEVKLGQLAAQKAGSDDVKAFGQKMVDDHTKLNDEMARVADSMGVRLPKTMAKEDQAEYDKLNGLSGNEFDMEYLTFMVRDHHKDLHDFRMEASSPTDPALHDAVTKGEGVIREHTLMVDKLARAKGVPMPTRGNRPTPSPSL